MDGNKNKIPKTNHKKSLNIKQIDELSYKNNMLVDSECSQILATCSRDINYKCGGTLRTPCLKEQKNELLRIEDTLILYANQKHVSFSK